MRKGFQCKFIEQDGKVVGINLGCDAVSEHEWGIEKIREAFHIDDSRIGFEHFVAKPPFPELHVLRNGDEMMVVYDPIFQFLNKRVSENFKALQGDFELQMFFDDLAAAWDDESFGIAVRGKENQEKLTQAILEPYKDGDLMILFTRLFAKTPGLTILRASAFPEEEKTKMREAHEDRIALEHAAEETGIAERLRKAGKDYYALSPRWTKDFQDVKTGYPIMFWLNPIGQDKNNWGWFTVEDLLAWVDNKGPIPKT